MQTLSLSLLGELDLSQIASRIGWEFLKLCRGEVRKSPQEIAKLAQEVSLAVQAAEVLVAGKDRDIEDFPGINNIPPLKRRMLVAEGERRDVNISRYQAIREYALRHNEVIQDVASGKREPTVDELQELRQHFALLSLILAEAGL